MGCGKSQLSDPRSALAEAKRLLDDASAVHFHLTGTDTPPTGQHIDSGDGDASRPAQFQGKLSVSFNGFLVPINIVSVGHTFYVELPPYAGYQKADPSKYSFGDPAVLLDRDRGLSSLLIAAKNPTVKDRTRFQGEELDEISASLPGDLVGRLLTSADTGNPKQDFTGIIGLNVDTHQLRRVSLTGLFLDPRKASTYTLVLDKYGENVSITPPA